MKPIAQHVEELFDKYCSTNLVDAKAEANIRDYVRGYLTAIQRGDPIVLRLVDERLLADLHFSSVENGKDCLEKINRELERVGKSLPPRVAGGTRRSANRQGCGFNSK